MKRASSSSSGSADGAGAAVCRAGGGGRPVIVVCSSLRNDGDGDSAVLMNCPGKTSCYSFIQFFSQKLCIGIALIDTFLSIAAHLWSPPYSYPITFLWGGGGRVPKEGGGFSGLKTKPVQTAILPNYLINQSEWMRWITRRRGHLAIIYHFSMCMEHDKMSFRSIFDKTNEVFQFFLPFDKLDVLSVISLRVTE
jgi:hypothetical protein